MNKLFSGVMLLLFCLTESAFAEYGRFDLRDVLPLEADRIAIMAGPADPGYERNNALMALLAKYCIKMGFTSWAGHSMQTLTCERESTDSKTLNPLTQQEITQFIQDHTLSYLNLFKNIRTLLSHDSLVSELKKPRPNHNYRSELLRYAKAPYTTPEGLLVQYAGHEEFMDDEPLAFAFHGTRSTLEIMEDWVLKPHYSKSGFGTYFGRSYYESSAYASSRSSNVNETFKFPVASILVFERDRNRSFVRNNAGVFGTVKEWILDGEYSLDFLRSTLFINRKNALSFSEILKSKPDLKKKLSTVSFYDLEYLPFSVENHFSEFEKVFLQNVEAIFQDLGLIVWAVTSPYYNSEQLEDEIVTLLRINARENDEYTIRLLEVAINEELSKPIKLIVDDMTSSSLAKLLTTKKGWNSLLDGTLGSAKSLKIFLNKVKQDPEALQAIDSQLSENNFRSLKTLFQPTETLCYLSELSLSCDTHQFILSKLKKQDEPKMSIQVQEAIQAIFKQCPDLQGKF